MNKIIYKFYDKLFFYFYQKNQLTYFKKTIYRKIIESKLFIFLLKKSTKYILKEWLTYFYCDVKNYDRINTNGILQFPKIIKNVSTYSYLFKRIILGYHPTLISNPITLKEILFLNPYKKDKQYTIFLKKYLTYYWNNSNKHITKSLLDKILND